MKLALALSLALTCAINGCARLAPLLYHPARIAECNEALPSTRAIAGGDFVRRLRLHTTAGTVSDGFEVVVQKRGLRLTVVALTRFGTRAFSIVQNDRELNVEIDVPAMQVIPPRNVLLDLYHWPLRGIRANGEDARLSVEENGNSATIENTACGYRTAIVELSHERQ